MKKYLFMLLAAMFCLTATVTLTSCGDDDESVLGDSETFYFKFDINQGNLTGDDLTAFLAATGSSTSSFSEEVPQSVAVLAFSSAVSSIDSSVQKAIDDVKAKGYTGVSITFSLTDASGNVIKQQVWQ